MNLWSRWRSGLGKGDAQTVRARRFQPRLECLEDRCVPAVGFNEIVLTSDIPAIARNFDPNLSKPVGLANSPTGPFWLSVGGAGASDVLDGRGQIVPLVVTVPSVDRSGVGDPTGVVFNGGRGFVISKGDIARSATFIFATEQGAIFGWNSLVDSADALPVIDNSATGSYFSGLALATNAAGQTFLYAADFANGAVDIFDQNFEPVRQAGAFQDPNLSNGFAPFNVQNINNQIYVAYAQHDATRPEEIVAGAGTGFIDVFDANGRFVSRLASGGALNAPWGMALAPADFGPFGGALLVGNNGDGRISAYDAASGALLGQVFDDNGAPITIPGLWALSFGNGHAGGDSSTLFITAGINSESNGLFGAIQSPLKKGADTGGAGKFNPHAFDEPVDYPLPPITGPAFKDPGPIRVVPIAVLLPRTDSSLILIPTLSSFKPSLPPVSANAPIAGGNLSVTAQSIVDAKLLPNVLNNDRLQLDAGSSVFSLAKLRGWQTAEPPLTLAATDGRDDAGARDAAPHFRQVNAAYLALFHAVPASTIEDQLAVESRDDSMDNLVAEDLEDQPAVACRPDSSDQQVAGDKAGSRMNNHRQSLLLAAGVLPVLWCYSFGRQVNMRRPDEEVHDDH